MAERKDVQGQRPRLIEDRSSRVIAVCRLVLAITFGLVIWLDPEQPARTANSGLILLAIYVSFALALLPVAWNNWWLDFRAAPLTFVVDGLVFVAAVYFTESPSTDFVSPILAFFTFLMLTATVRWSWRVTLIAAAVLAGSYMAVGFIMAARGMEVSQVRLTRRVIYMAVLSLMLIWFGLRQRPPEVLPFDATGPDDDAVLLALRHAMRALGAKAGAIAWADADEPRLLLQTAGTIGERRESIAPDLIDFDDGKLPMLFARGMRRMMERDVDGRFHARFAEVPGGMAQRCGMSEGLSLPLLGETGEGRLLLSGIPGLSRDEIARGTAVAREVSAGIDRAEMARVSREADLMRLRGTLARDLHDSVAQSLAGASFRLQALRDAIGGGKDPVPEIDAISQSLRTEQAHVRNLIEQLRRGQLSPGSRNLVPELRELLAMLAQQWGIATILDCAENAVPAPALLVFDMQQIVREAVANAVRHGGAAEVRLTLWVEGSDLALTIADNGTGFVGSALPRSLSERVAALSGTLAIASQQGDTRLDIRLPGKGRT